MSAQRLFEVGPARHEEASSLGEMLIKLSQMTDDEVISVGDQMFDDEFRGLEVPEETLRVIDEELTKRKYIS